MIRKCSPSIRNKKSSGGSMIKASKGSVATDPNDSRASGGFRQLGVSLNDSNNNLNLINNSKLSNSANTKNSAQIQMIE